MLGGVGGALPCLVPSLHAERINAAAIASGIADGAWRLAQAALRDAPASTGRTLLAGKLVEAAASVRSAWLVTQRAAAEAARDEPVEEISALAKMAASLAALDATTLGMDVDSACRGQPSVLMEQFFRDARLYIVAPRSNDVLADLLAKRWLDKGASAFAARSDSDAVACRSIEIARVAWTEAAAYAKERVVSGQPIAAFQAVRHRLVACRVQIDCASELAAQARNAADSGWTDGIAQIAARRAATQAVQTGMEVLGAAGFDLRQGMPAHYLAARSPQLMPAIGRLVEMQLAQSPPKEQL